MDFGSKMKGQNKLSDAATVCLTPVTLAIPKVHFILSS